MGATGIAVQRRLSYSELCCVGSAWFLSPVISLPNTSWVLCILNLKTLITHIS